MKEFRRLLYHAVRLKPEGTVIAFATDDGTYWTCLVEFRDAVDREGKLLPAAQGRSGEEALRYVVRELCGGNADHFEALGPAPDGWGDV